MECKNETALDGPTSRKEESMESIDSRIRIRITGSFTRPIDPDNIVIKDIIDGLRKAVIIPNDRPEDISILTDQVKVSKSEEEKTEVVIIWPT